MKTLILVLIFSIYILGYSPVHANLIINEIMYDLEGADEGREWIEIYNQGPESVELLEYKFFEAGINHKLVLESGSSKLGGMEYAVLVSNPKKFKDHYPYFVGNILDSSFTLSNTGELIALKDKDLNVVDQVSYSSSMGAAGNGRTLVKIGDVWREGKPTLGLVNEVYLAPVISTSQKTPQQKLSVVDVVKSQKVVVALDREEKIEVKPSLSASVMASIEEGEVANNSGNFYLPILASFGLIGFSAVVVYLIRRQGAREQGADFTILED